MKKLVCYVMFKRYSLETKEDQIRSVRGFILSKNDGTLRLINLLDHKIINIRNNEILNGRMVLEEI